MKLYIALTCIIVILCGTLALSHRSQVAELVSVTQAGDTAVGEAEAELASATDRLVEYEAMVDTAHADIEARDVEIERLNLAVADSATEIAILVRELEVAASREVDIALDDPEQELPMVDRGTANSAEAKQEHDKALNIELGKRVAAANLLLPQIRRCAALGRAAEAKLEYAQNNRGIYKTVKKQTRCRTCRGAGKITERKSSHTTTKKCGRCGGDGTYTTSQRQRTGTRSIDAEEKAVKQLTEQYEALKQAYNDKQAEADVIREQLGLPLLAETKEE